MVSIAPSLLSTDTQLLLRDKYELAYGIFNHDAVGDTRPLSLIAMQKAEDTYSGSSLSVRVNQFSDFNVLKYFGCSFNEFLELPTYVCNMILEVSAKRTKVEGNVADTLLNKLEH